MIKSESQMKLIFMTRLNKNKMNYFWFFCFYEVVYCIY